MSDKPLCKIIETPVAREWHEVRLDGNQLQHRVRRPDTIFTPWNDQDVPDVPSGCVDFDIESDYGTSHNLQVCAVGNDGLLYHSVRRYDNGYWTPMNETSDDGTGKITQENFVIGTVSCRERGRKTLDVVVGPKVGFDLYFASSRDEVSGPWTAWKALPFGQGPFGKETNCSF